MTCNWASSLDEGGGGVVGGADTPTTISMSGDHCAMLKSDSFDVESLIRDGEPIFAEDKVVGFQQAITRFAQNADPLYAPELDLSQAGGEHPQLTDSDLPPAYYDYPTTPSPELPGGSSPASMCLAQPLEPGTGIYPGPPIAFVDPRGPHEVYNRVPLGEKGRMELKAAIRQALKNRPELREKVNAVAKLRCATIPQLLQIAAICDLWFMALNISRRFVETRTGKQKRRPAPSSLSGCSVGGGSGSSSPEMMKTRAKSKLMKRSGSVELSPMLKAAEDVVMSRNITPAAEVHRSMSLMAARCLDAQSAAPSSIRNVPVQPAPPEALDPTGWGLDWDPTLVGDSLFGAYF